MKELCSKYRTRFLVVSFFLLHSTVGYGHAINYVMEKAPGTEVFWFYLKLGFGHIIPGGIDHILFVIGLCLLTNKISAILWQATAFTVAHSITLMLSMRNIIMAPAAIVEPIIALSILFVAAENILVNELKPWRIGIVFLFGLLHGMGFASSLNETGLPRNQFFTSILSFNVGIELGQLAIITALFLFILLPLQAKISFKYKQWVTYPLSALIGIIAIYWTIQRMFA
jgi:HupE / UreJ protein